LKRELKAEVVIPEMKGEVFGCLVMENFSVNNTLAGRLEKKGGQMEKSARRI